MLQADLKGLHLLCSQKSLLPCLRLVCVPLVTLNAFYLVLDLWARMTSLLQTITFESKNHVLPFSLSYGVQQSILTWLPLDEGKNTFANPPFLPELFILFTKSN